MALPGALLPWVECRFLKVTDDGLVPNALGFVEFRDTDLTTPKDVWTNSDLTIAHTNPVELDDEGRPASPIYLSPSGYSVYVYDADMVLLYSVDFVEDPGSAFLNQWGTIQTQGTVATSSPYIVQDTDNCVIVDSATTPFVVQLPAAVDRGTPLLIKNISAGVTVRVTPESPEAIDSISAYVELGPFVAPPAPLMMLLSDGVSAWIIASYYNG